MSKQLDKTVTTEKSAHVYLLDPSLFKMVQETTQTKNIIN